MFGRAAVAYFAATLVPSAAWVLAQSGGSGPGVFFAPSLFVHGFFWRGWLRQLALVVGIPELLASMIGVALFVRGRAAALVRDSARATSFWRSRSNYRVATHDYYSPPLAPLVEIGLGLVVAADRSGRTAAVQGLAIAGIILSFVVEWPWIDPLHDSFQSAERAAEFGQIGVTAAHTDNAIILAPVDERAMEYYGWVAGRRWPSSVDLDVNNLGGVANTPTTEPFAQVEKAQHPRWFIVGDLPDLSAQPILKTMRVHPFG